MAKILIVDGGVPFHGVGGTLNHSYAELAQKTLTAMGHEATITRVDGNGRPRRKPISSRRPMR